MSDRDDIPDKLTYTCNCGWIDKNHMRDPATVPFVGAKNLWKQFQDPELAAWPSGHVPVIKDPNFKPGPGFPYPYRTEEDYVLLPDGRKGFKVRYEQQMGYKKLRVWRSGEYLVADGLTLEQKKSVALAIFMEISMKFESLQGYFSLATDSSFSREDLVSNVIGFYIAVEGFTEEGVMRRCKEVSADAARAVWDRDGAVGAKKNKNRDFSPVFSQCEECSQSPRFPVEFQSIEPAHKGVDFIDFPTRRGSGQYWPNPK